MNTIMSLNDDTIIYNHATYDRMFSTKREFYHFIEHYKSTQIVIFFIV